MNLSTVKWAQWDKTQSRELLVCSYVCASNSAQLLHTILRRTDLIVFPLPSRQSPLLRWRLFEGRGAQYDPKGSATRELEETTRASPYHVAEHHPARSESLQPHTEQSRQPGSELSSVKADVYIWRYTLLAVHAKKKKIRKTRHPWWGRSFWSFITIDTRKPESILHLVLDDQLDYCNTILAGNWQMDTHILTAKIMHHMRSKCHAFC